MIKFMFKKQVKNAIKYISSERNRGINTKPTCDARIWTFVGKKKEEKTK